jgi:hypothetical protein
MTMNPLPPQAYTKDILLKAYQWLMLQNSSIKEMATTPDILVSLYLKATRDGDHALDRPSIQNFKKELRSLAGMMGELDRPVVAPTPTPTPAAQPAPQPILRQQHVMPNIIETPVAAATQTQVSYTEKTMTATSLNVDLMEQLDCTSRAMIQEVKEQFNLSSDAEALRMLIKVGYTRSKNLLS